MPVYGLQYRERLMIFHSSKQGDIKKELKYGNLPTQKGAKKQSPQGLETTFLGNKKEMFHLR